MEELNIPKLIKEDEALAYNLDSEKLEKGKDKIKTEKRQERRKEQDRSAKPLLENDKKKLREMSVTQLKQEIKTIYQKKWKWVEDGRALLGAYREAMDKKDNVEAERIKEVIDATKRAADQLEVQEQQIKKIIEEKEKSVKEKKTEQAKAAAKPLEKRANEIYRLELASLGIRLLEAKTDSISKLTKKDFETIKGMHEEIQETFEYGSNVKDIIKNLETIGVELKSKISGIRIEFPLKNTKNILIWDYRLGHRNNGFGDLDKGEAALIGKIFDIKRDQFGGSFTPAYEKFHALSVTKQAEKRKAKKEAEKEQKLKKNYKHLTTLNYELDAKIGDLEEPEMRKNWTQFEGHRAVENIMMQSPFELISRNQVRGAAVAIICIGRDSRVEFNHIFEYMKGGFRDIDHKIIPAELLKDGDKFMEAYENTKDKQKAKYMYEKVIAPCIKLLLAMARLRTPKEGLKKEKLTDKKILKKGLAPDQEYILNPLRKLFGYKEKSADAWEKFVGLISGAEKKITMSAIDGQKFALDEGMFRRHYNPDSALAELLNTKGMYRLDRDGLKVINQQKLLKEINKILERGYAQLSLQDSIKGIKAKKDIGYQLGDLSGLDNMTNEQKLAFQLGFINLKINQSEKKIRETNDTLLENAPPAIKALLQKIADEGVPPQQLAKIKSALLGIGYLHFHDAGKGYKISGVGLGKDIDLGDGYSLLIGAGADTKNQVPALNVGLNIQIAKSSKSVITLTPTIGLQGMGIALSNKRDLGNGFDLSWGVGAGFLPWEKITGMGAGLDFSYEGAVIKAKEESATKEQLEKSGLSKDLWEKWATLTNDKKWEMVKTLKSFKIIEGVMKQYPDILTQENVVKMISNYIEQIKGNIYENVNAMPFVPVGISVGALNFATGPVGLIAGLKFQLGSATIFIPHPKEESRILEQISNSHLNASIKAKMTEQAKKTFEEFVIGKNFKFVEKSPSLYMKPGSDLGVGIRTESKEVSLEGLEENELPAEKKKTETEKFNETNERLQTAELRIVKRENNVTEFVIDNDDDKDVEVHIDPMLHSVGLIVDSGRIFIKGDLNDLIITRERFTFPFAMAEEQASIRDVITIRQKKSISGNRDRLVIEKLEREYLEKITGQEGYKIQEGLNPDETTSGIVRAEGYATGKLSKEAKRNVENTGRILKELEKAKEEGPRLTLKTRKAMEKQIKLMRNALNTLTEKVYQASQEMPISQLNEELEKLYSDKNFKKEFREMKTIENPEKIAELIFKYRKNQGLRPYNDKEMNTAVSSIIHRWFSTLYKERKWDKLSKQEKTEINDRLLITLQGNANYTKKRYVEIFAEIKNKLGGAIKSAPEKMAEEFTAGIYNQLMNAIMENPEVNFGEAIVTGKGLKPGDILISGTVGYDAENNNKRRAAITKTINFEPLEGEKKFGFIKTTGELKDVKVGRNYSLREGGINGDIAKALLEMTSPLPKADNPQGKLDLLKSPLALKILGTGAYRLIVDEENGGGQEQYQAMIEVMKDPSLLLSKTYDKNIAKFREFVQKVRDAQSSGKPLLIKTTYGATIKIDMKKIKIRSGAYVKCGNPSVAVREDWNIEILKPGRKIKREIEKSGTVGEMQTTNEVIDNELTKRFLSFSLFSGFTNNKPKPQPKGGKHAVEGPHERANEPGKTPNQGPREVNTASGTQTVDTGPGSRGGSPSGR